ncbi:hypothetical protein BUALT_Bualt16G0056600 [Buddleja alternifolia]|uniref:Uncharacterized protein n=1 Tax=Buddleja alternifolia TaxID=168488 RepID=A0AAV6W734_9LAMI|nr:hypothetical protein BUALT_Bualt16G0056600 [Buddleja alternifolia]
MNSGVCISESYYNDSSVEYYGELLEILELTFLGPDDNIIVMFKCKCEQASLEGVYQRLSSSNLVRVVLDHKFDNIDILTHDHLQDEEVNPDELHPQGRELEQEVEFDDLKKGFVEPNEKESGDEDDFVFSDRSSGD